MATFYKENLYKMFYRWHLSSDRWAKMYSNRSSKCCKYDKKPGTYLVDLWYSKKIGKKIHICLVKIIKKHIDFKAELFLLGIPESIDKQNVYLIPHILTAARIIFAQYWKNEEAPTDQ